MAPATAAPPTAEDIAAATAAGRRPRERAEPGALAPAAPRAYRALWASGPEADWAPFLRPSEGGFQQSRRAAETVAGTRALPAAPGVYEFALAAEGERVAVVYVGVSKNLRRRHHVDYRGPGGSHLRDEFQAALDAGLSVWRRVRAVEGADLAAEWERASLSIYDYPWNRRQNGARRPLLEDQPARCCARCQRPPLAFAAAKATREGVGRKRE